MVQDSTKRFLDLTELAGRVATDYQSSVVDIDHLILALLLDNRALVSESLGLSLDQITAAHNHLLQKVNDQLLRYLFSLVIERLEERKIAFDYGADLIEILGQQLDPTDPRSDAQQLKHLFHKLVANPLMETLIAETVSSGDHILAASNGAQITFSVKHA